MTAQEYYNSTRPVPTMHWSLGMVLSFAEEYHKKMVEKIPNHLDRNFIVHYEVSKRHTKIRGNYIFYTKDGKYLNHKNIVNILSEEHDAPVHEIIIINIQELSKNDMEYYLQENSI